jgi:DNA mismatch repair protein MutL
VAEGADCIYLIDQHAAQERVNYEKFMQQLLAGIETQAFLHPIVLELAPKTFSLVMANLETLAKLGFGIHEFGTNTIVVNTYPVILPNQDRQLVLDLIEELEGAKNKIAEEKERLLTLRACKASVKANQSLTLVELSRIMEALSEAESPYTCPHGRPIVLRLTIDELEKLFKRK